MSQCSSGWPQPLDPSASIMSQVQRLEVCAIASSTEIFLRAYSDQIHLCLKLVIVCPLPKGEGSPCYKCKPLHTLWNILSFFGFFTCLLPPEPDTIWKTTPSWVSRAPYSHILTNHVFKSEFLLQWSNNVPKAIWVRKLVYVSGGHKSSSKETNAGTQGKKPKEGNQKQRPCRKDSYQMLPTGWPTVFLHSPRPIWLEVATPTVGLDLLYQLVIKKMLHRHAHGLVWWKQLLSCDLLFVEISACV